MRIVCFSFKLVMMAFSFHPGLAGGSVPTNPPAFSSQAPPRLSFLLVWES